MKLNVKLSGSEAVRRQLLRIGAQAAQKALDKTVVEVEDYVRREAGQHTRTGALFASVDKHRTPDGWEIFHDLQRAPHAMFVHWGTRPHVIRPTGSSLASQRELYGPGGSQRGLTAAGRLKPMPGGRKLVLRFPVGGGFRFAQFVNHPGYKGDPWMVRAAALAPAIFTRHVQDQINRLSAPGA